MTRASTIIAIARLQAVRTRRDPALLLMWTVIFALPLLLSLLVTGGAIHLLGLTGLLLPLWVARDWGADIDTGALGVIGLRLPAGAVSLLASRALLYGTMIILCAVPCLALGRVSWIEGLFVTCQLLQLTLFGLLLATVLRSQQAGWIPLFAAIFGVFLPFAYIQTRLAERGTPLLLEAVMLVFVPHLGVKQGVFSLQTAAIGSAVLAALWLLIACLVTTRPAALTPATGARR